MKSRFSNIVAGATALAAIFFVAGPANAGEIALTLVDNEITISGEFLGFKNGAYIIETSAGELNVPAIYVVCDGADCLNILSDVSSTSG